MPIWEKLVGEGKKKTLKDVKKHSTLKRKTLSEHMVKTLGSGNLRLAVSLPEKESKEDWLAANTVDFFNECSLLYGLCVDDAQRFTQPGEGFPPGVEYRWEAAGKKPIRVSSPEYVDFVMSWVEDQIDNPNIFPELETVPFPDDFEDYIKDIFKRLFRIFAIIYHKHFKCLEGIDAVAHLNTVFKHFMYFCFEFDLVDEKETKVLKGPVARLKEEYDAEEKA